MSQSRRCVLGWIKHVKQVLITTGSGWMDADPEIPRLEPDHYVAYKDSDQGGKHEFCAELGIEFPGRKPPPAPGLPNGRRTALRDF